MRLRAVCIGALNLFVDRPKGLGGDARILGQALADVASIGILNERFVREQQVVTEQLQVALNSRVVLEQAKGVIAAQAGIDVDAAFALIRGYARRNNRRLSDVVTDIANRRVAADALQSLPR